jgi:hypothetical protein
MYISVTYIVTEVRHCHRGDTVTYQGRGVLKKYLRGKMEQCNMSGEGVLSPVGDVGSHISGGDTGKCQEKQ